MSLESVSYKKMGWRIQILGRNLGVSGVFHKNRGRPCYGSVLHLNNPIRYAANEMEQKFFTLNLKQNTTTTTTTKKHNEGLSNGMCLGPFVIHKSPHNERTILNLGI
jgi:hypothetical protein